MSIFVLQNQTTMTHFKFVKTTLTKNLYLYNTEVRNNTDWGEPHPYVFAYAGEEIDVWVQYYSDGRIYYTAFRKDREGNIYTYTHMKSREGKIILNCGGIQSSSEIKKYLND